MADCWGRWLCGSFRILRGFRLHLRAERLRRPPRPGSAGLFVYAAVFSVFLWRRFASQYRGEELSETAAPVPAAARALAKPADSSDRLSALSPQVATVVRKEFRYLTRNTFSFFTLIMPPVMVLIFGTK